MTLALSAWHWGPPAAKHVALVRLQRRCLDYVPPQPARVIYDDDPATVPSLLATPGWDAHPAMPRPANTAAVFENPLSTAYALNTGRRRSPTVFMGRRTSPAGNARLVIVMLSLVPGGTAFAQFVLRPEVEVPRAITRGGAVAIPSPAPDGLELFAAPGDRTTFIEGRADPADASHFTIDYVHNGTPGTIDGWLNADNTVTLGPRAGDVVELNPIYRWWSPTPRGLPPHNYTGGPLGATGPFDATTRPVLPKRDDPRYK